MALFVCKTQISVLGHQDEASETKAFVRASFSLNKNSICVVSITVSAQASNAMHSFTP